MLQLFKLGAKGTSFKKKKQGIHTKLFFFNLIPYREDLVKKQKNIAVMAVMGAIMAALLLGYYTDGYVAGLAQIQQNNLAYLKTVNGNLLKKVKSIVNLRKERARIENKDQLIGLLQNRRSVSVKIFNSLLRDTPADVFLTKFTLTRHTADLSGYAAGNNKVALYMKNLEKSKTFTDPVLKVVSKATLSNNAAVSFDLQVSLRDIKAVPLKTKGVN